MFDLRMASIVCINRPLNYLLSDMHMYPAGGRMVVVGINKSARVEMRRETSDATAVKTM